MLTNGCRAYITIFYKAHHFTLSEGVLLATDLYIAYVARYAEGYEHHEIVPMEQAFSLSRHRLYPDTLKEW